MVYEVHDYVCDRCGLAWPSWGQAEMCENGHEDEEKR